MKFSLLGYCGFGVGLAVATLAGCGGWQAQVGTAAPAQLERGLKRGASSGGDLLYVAGRRTSSYTYPGGTFVEG